MSNGYNEFVYVYAKPSATYVQPFNIFVQPLALSGSQIKTLNITGRSFSKIQNVYLSAADPSIFQGNISFFNPFSTTRNLYPTNPGFYASVIPNFMVVEDTNIIFDIPDSIFYYINSLPPPFLTFIDVIIENEAGYALLSRDSIKYPVSSWSGFTFDQNPSISGICILGKQFNPAVRSGYIIFSDMNWLVTENNPTNIFDCQKLFDTFFGGNKSLYCARYVNNLTPVYVENYTFGVYYDGATEDTGISRENFCPVLHNAIDPLGYKFTAVDITQPGASDYVHAPFFMHLYPYGIYTSVFNDVVITNLREIAKKQPVIICGEWRNWSAYDNYIIQDVMKYTSEEVYYYADAVTNGIPNTLNYLGLILSDAGVAQFIYNAVGLFNGTLAKKYAFAVSENSNNMPTMMQLPYRP